MRLLYQRIIVLISLCALFSAASASASVSASAATSATDSQPAPSTGLWQQFSQNVAETWRNFPHQDLYVPAITWHNRFTYDDEHIRRYNERPWGAGYGISCYDEKGNWHALYVMAFKDSFNKWEPFGGYAWEKQWHPFDRYQDIHFGAGFTAGVTARDNWKYIPVPALLPLASVGYKQLTFQSTYIPGTYNNGNVFFAWLRYRF